MPDLDPEAATATVPYGAHWIHTADLAHILPVPRGMGPSTADTQFHCHYHQSGAVAAEAEGRNPVVCTALVPGKGGRA